MENWKRALSLAFQSLGVIYGDIGTSPLYVYASTFPDEIKDTEDVIGVLSLIIYSILLLPLLKYVFIVLRANDNGDGGTFALYSLICRYAKVSLIPNEQPEDRELSNYSLVDSTPSTQLKRAHKIKHKLEHSFIAQLMLFLLTILGTSMVIGNGILTPCISVLSAVSGIQSLSKHTVVGVSIAILVILFCIQRFGTDKPTSYTSSSEMGRKDGSHLVKLYFASQTGTEAMLADLGHFNILAVQVCSNPIYWLTFVVAVAAAIIASQAMISGAFAIITQSLSLGFFPRVKVVHTLAKYEGQVYIPEINYMLMVACVIVTLVFKTTEKIGNAYGIAMVAVMVITMCLVNLIMLVIWKTSIWWIASFFVVFGAIEAVYLSSVLYKFKQGGFLPLAFSLVLMTVMGIWHYIHKQRYMFELNNKVSGEYVRDLSTNPGVNRVPGIGLLYSELVQVLVSIKSIPISRVALEERFLFRQVEPREYRMYRCVVRYGYKDKIEESKEFELQLVEYLKEFIKHEHFNLEGNNVRDEQQEAVLNIQTYTLLVQDQKDDHDKSATGGRSRPSSSLVVHIEESLQQQQKISASASSRVSSRRSIQSFNGAKSSNSIIAAGTTIQGSAVEEMQLVQRAKENGVVYLLGEAEVVAKQNSPLFKRFIVNYAYSFLTKNFRQGEKAMEIPQTRLLRFPGEEEPDALASLQNSEDMIKEDISSRAFATGQHTTPFRCLPPPSHNQRRFRNIKKLNSVSLIHTHRSDVDQQQQRAIDNSSTSIPTLITALQACGVLLIKNWLQCCYQRGDGGRAVINRSLLLLIDVAAVGVYKRDRVQLLDIPKSSLVVRWWWKATERCRVLAGSESSVKELA
ncbi:hypothetical protein LguiA_025692 [Lonicera macranthoides]